MAWKKFHHQRYLLATMGFLAVVVAYALRACLNMCITVMVKDPKKPESKADFDWDQKTQGYILGSFYIGYAIMHVPGGYLAQRFGGKQTLGIGIVITASFTILTPLAANAGAVWFIVLRICMGLGEGTTFPGLNQLLAAWIPLRERSRVGAFVFAGTQVGISFANTVSGYILHFTDNNWAVAFYFFGILGIIWYIIFCVLCYNDPNSNPFISQEEKDFLEKEIGSLSRSTDLPPTPWHSIATSPPLIALAIAQSGHDWGLFTITTDLPKYMSSVLNFSVKDNGLLSAMPFIFQWLFAILAGWLSDRLVKKKTYSVTVIRKIFTLIGFFGPAIGILLASFAGMNRELAVFSFTLGMAFMGFYYPSIRVNTLDLSPNYAGVLMGIVNGLSSITGIFTPVFTGHVITNDTLTEWRIVFMVTFSILIVSAIIYLIFGSGEIQPWNGPKTNPAPEAPEGSASEATNEPSKEADKEEGKKA
uniref:Inorganic phosphate cotransporter n=1 Tax=Cacopsylla melanoneura TaxID=428564 RepID=A0A8D8VYQ6_9HEMI